MIYHHRFDYIFLYISEEAPGFNVQTKLSEDLNIDPQDDPQKFISILIESLFILRKIPEAAEVTIYQYSYSVTVYILQRLLIISNWLF